MCPYICSIHVELEEPPNYFATWLYHVPFPSDCRWLFWGPGSCIFFFSYKDLDDSYDQAVVESTGSESSTVLLTVTAGAVAVFLLHQCPAALEGHADCCAENSSGMPVCRAVSASRKRISNRVSSGVRSSRPESIFFFVLIFFLKMKYGKEI